MKPSELAAFTTNSFRKISVVPTKDSSSFFAIFSSFLNDSFA
jgi:hypothetical protein